MKVSIKNKIYFLLFFLIIGASAYTGYKFSFVGKHTNIQQDVLLERIENVIKLGTVEGVFSEIFNYSDYYSYDISPFRKKALIKIRAHVLIGFEMDSITIDVNYLTRKVVISDIPKARILSIDHELEYYDITEGTFNSFTKDDYNMLQKQSKGFIRKKAMESDLFERAEVQLNDHILMLNWFLTDAGWELDFKRDGEKGYFN